MKKFVAYVCRLHTYPRACARTFYCDVILCTWTCH